MITTIGELETRISQLEQNHKACRMEVQTEGAHNMAWRERVAKLEDHWTEGGSVKRRWIIFGLGAVLGFLTGAWLL